MGGDLTGEKGSSGSRSVAVIVCGGRAIFLGALPERHWVQGVSGLVVKQAVEKPA